MPILTQKALVLAKVEVTSGTDAVPDETNDAFLCIDPVFTVDATNLERNFARPDFSQYPSRVGKKLAQVAFSIQMAGNGVAGEDPVWGVLFRGCSMARSVLTTPARIRYTPVTSAQESLTIYVYYEGLLHKVTGAMGTFSIQAEAGAYATINFTFTGTYSTPVDSTYPASPVLEDVVPPQVELASFSYGGDSTLIANSFRMDMDNNVVSRPDLNSANGFLATRISGRDPKGGFDPEVEEDQTFWTKMEASTLSALTLNIGTTAGNKITLAAPKCQITGVSYGDRDNLRNYDLSLMFRRDTGNDEFTVTFE